MGRLGRAWRKVKKAVKKVVKKVVNTVKKIVRVVKDFVHKVIGFVDQILSLIGIRPKKYLRMKVIILKKDGKPVVDEKKVQQWYEMTKKLMLEKCNIEVRSPNLVLPAVVVADEDAPDHALTSKCSIGAAFGEDNDYYETLTKYSITSTSSAIADFLGYGEPFYVIVIEHLTNALGCSHPFILNFAVLEDKAGSTTIGHEFGHVAWLRQRNNLNENLMNSNRNIEVDYELTRWQISKIRNSRYVIYAPRRG